MNGNEIVINHKLTAEDNAALLFNLLIDTVPASVSKILTERLSAWWSGAPIVEKRPGGRPRKNAASENPKVPYVNWSELLPLLPTRFTAIDVHNLPQCTNKLASEIYAGILRWVSKKQVKKVDRGVYEKLSSSSNDNQGNGSLPRPLLKSKSISQSRHHRDEYVALMREILEEGDLTVEDLSDRIDRKWGAGASYGMFQFRTAANAKIYTSNGRKWWGLNKNNAHAA